MAGAVGRWMRAGAHSLRQTAAASSSSAGSPASPSPSAARSASLQKVKQRIKSVRNIGKITKAMKMVAASRLRSVQNRCEQSRGSIKLGLRSLGDLPSAPSERTTIVSLSSDRGLCGAINTNIVKHTKVLRDVCSDLGADWTLVPLGDKGRSQIMRTGMKTRVPFIFLDATKLAPSYSLAVSLAEKVLETSFDKCHIVFNRFNSAISFRPSISTVLSAPTLETAAEQGQLSIDQYEIEGPERDELLQNLSEFQLALTLHNSILESSTSEVASRMQAMESSSKSANEMLDKLNLTYNRTRQAQITNELIEVTSGAAAV